MIPKINVHFSLYTAGKAFIEVLQRKPTPTPQENFFFINHARTGLRIALTALQLPPNSKIGVGMYNCYTVMNAIKKAGYIPVFIDVTNDFLLDIQDLKKKNKDISALIVTHLFGIPNNMDEITYICQNIPIIEDCAHAYLSKDSSGVLVGMRGDCSVYSIGQGKFPSIGDGGILQVNNAKLLPIVEQEYSKLANSTLKQEIMAIAQSVVKSVLHKPFIYRFVLPLKRKSQEKKMSENTYGHTEKHIYSYVLSLYKKEKPRVTTYLKKQQNNVRRLLPILENIKDVYVPCIDTDNNNCFMLPFVCEDRISLIRNCEKNGIEIAPHFSKCIEWGHLFGYTLGDCPNAEKLAQQMLVIPCSYNLSKSQVKKIVNVLIEYSL
ncbi:MAG: DegT/DnrJ/EryC1/StrS family aminotransferase [Eubacteriales bacterium]